jgi:hypothetical protein
LSRRQDSLSWTLRTLLAETAPSRNIPTSPYGKTPMNLRRFLPKRLVRSLPEKSAVEFRPEMLRNE